MSNISITEAELPALFKRALDEKGTEYVYHARGEDSNPCVYFEGEQPSCLLGHVLAYKGLTAADVASANRNSAGIMSLIFTAIVEPENERVTHALRAAQDYQDEKLNWGYAVELALEELAPSND